MSTRSRAALADYHPLPSNLLNLIVDERTSATAKFGPLTRDPCRAVTLMAEELGEVARAVLQAGRDRRDTGCSAGARRHAQSELVQLMSLASLMFENLETEG